jgi:hypothetical protein
MNGKTSPGRKFREKFSSSNVEFIEQAGVEMSNEFTDSNGF